MLFVETQILFLRSRVGWNTFTELNIQFALVIFVKNVLITVLFNYSFVLVLCVEVFFFPLIQVV